MHAMPQDIERIAGQATALIDPAGEAFWGLAFLCWMSLRPPYYLTRAGAAKRRALHGVSVEL
jgi:hypothetical protein